MKTILDHPLIKIEMAAMSGKGIRLKKDEVAAIYPALKSECDATREAWSAKTPKTTKDEEDV